MSKEQENILQELLKVISDSKVTGDMSFSTGSELTKLVRMLQVA
jgi:hypothetical protein